MRAGDADRDAVLTALQEAHVQGRLTVEELLERQDQAMRVRFTDELAPLVADLPEGNPGGVAPWRPAGAVAPHEEAPWSVTVMSGKTFDLPAGTTHMRDVAVMGGHTIRLRDALGPGVVLTLELHNIMAGHTLIVPEGVRVRDETIGFMGGNEVKRHANGDGSNGTLVLKGWQVMGGNTIKLDRRFG